MRNFAVVIVVVCCFHRVDGGGGWMNMEGMRKVVTMRLIFNE